jgi:nephrocystin-3
MTAATDTTATPHKTHEIRVFLSSTFQDMEAERSHLVKQVLPKVRAACLARQVGFTEIDLRWGITEEEFQNGATVEICLKEIDRCRDYPPFFIGFLGERYGWIPKHDELAAYWARQADSDYVQPIRDAIARGISVTELEMELAVLDGGAAEKLRGQALFLLRDRELTDTLYRQAIGGEPDPLDSRYYDPATGRLAALKTRIRATPFLVRFDGANGYASIDEFGQAIEDYLLAQLDRLYPADAVPSRQERQTQAHAAFRFHRQQNYLPRPDVVATVRAALIRHQATPALGPVLLTGPSGQGKSALMADLADQLQGLADETSADADADGDTATTTVATTTLWQVIDHYIGADEDTSLDAWVERLFHRLLPEVSAVLGADTVIPASTKERREELKTWFAYAARRREKSAGRPVCFVLVLDALDQLGDGGRDLDWLKPEVIGADALVLASAAEGTPAREAAKDFEAIKVPPFAAELRARMIANTLQRYRKTLPPALVTRLADAPQSGSPLFLKLALEELRVDAHHDEKLVRLTALIDEILQAPTAQTLFLNRFLLDPDYSRPEQPDLAARFMALIGAARQGLSEDELADLLALSSDPVAADTDKPRLPQVHLSRLVSVFQPFLLNKAGNRAPMHRAFGEAAMNYLGEVRIREEIYAYFKPGYGREDGQDFQTRGAAEALHQLTALTQQNPLRKKQFRRRLISDLGAPHLGALLHEEHSQYLNTAIQTLTSANKRTIEIRWRVKLKNILNVCSTHLFSQLFNFGVWLRENTQFELALAVMETLSCSTHSRSSIAVSEASILNMLGRTYIDLGFHAKAEPFIERSIEIWQLTESDGPLIATGYYSYARLKSGNADYASATAFCCKALQMRKKCFGVKHPDTATSIDQLAGLLQLGGNNRAAIRLYNLAYYVRKSVLDDEHPHTASSLNNLATALYDAGEHERSECYFRKALVQRQKRLGERHPSVARSLNNLALVLSDQGNFEEAEHLLIAASLICESCFGFEHPDVARIHRNLAIIAMRAGSLPKAREHFQKSIPLFIATLGIHHDETVKAIEAAQRISNISQVDAAMRRAFRKFWMKDTSSPRWSKDGRSPVIELGIRSPSAD